MADIFTPIELEWDGKVHVVKPHRVMGLISQIEDVLTLSEIQGYAARGTAPMGKLCMAYARALRYAGMRISDEDVYAKAFEGPEEQEVISAALINLMTMMLPASARARLEALAEGDGVEVPRDDPGAEPGNGSAAAAPSPNKPSGSAVGRKKKAVRV